MSVNVENVARDDGNKLLGALNKTMDLFEQGQERSYLVEGKGVRSVTQSRVRIRMDFQEKAVGAGGNSRPGEVFHELPLAS